MNRKILWKGGIVVENERRCMPERIPLDVYQLRSQRQDRRGLTLVFEGVRWYITVEFGFLSLSVHSEKAFRPEPGRAQSGDNGETGLLYALENSADLRRFRAQTTAAGPKEELHHLVFLTAGDRIDVIAWGLPAVTVLPRRPEAAAQGNVSTPLGPVEILADGRPVPYCCTALPLQTRQFQVEGRWRLDCLLPGTAAPVEVVCRLAADPTLPVTGGPETDEALALLSLSWQNHKLCIGTEGDLPGVTYHYEERGLRLRFLTGPGVVSFYLAWLPMSDPVRQELDPWLAADPSRDETRCRP